MLIGSFWIDVAAGVLSSVIGGGAVAYAAYRLIDRRLQLANRADRERERQEIAETNRKSARAPTLTRRRRVAVTPLKLH